MRKITLTIAVLLILLNSCGGNQQETSLAKLSLAQIRSDNNFEFYLMGEEKYYVLKEVTEDKSAPIVQERARSLLDAVKEMDKQTDKSLKLIHDLQLKLLDLNGVNVKLTGDNAVVNKRDPQSNISPISFNLSKVANVQGNGKIDANAGELISGSLKKLRKIYSEKMVASAISWEAQKYYYRDPNIENYKSFKNLNEQIEKSIMSSNVSPDDQDWLKRVYGTMTKIIAFTEKSLNTENDWLVNFEVLTAIEGEILKTRNDVFLAIRYRVSGENYSFNKILTTVNGPAVVRKGEKIVLEVCLAAYDSDNQPKVEPTTGTLIETKEGKGFVEITGDKPGYKSVEIYVTE